MSTQVASLYARVGADTRQATAALRDVRTRLIDVTGHFKNLRDQSKMTGTVLNAAVGAALVAVGNSAKDMVAQYEKSMNVFQFATKASTEEMGLAQAAVKALANDLTLPNATAEQTAAALATLGKSGLSARDAIDALRPAMLLAAAGELEASAAAEILSDTLNAFGLKGREAARVADLLAGAEIASSASIKDVADAMRQASAVFASAKVPVDVLVTMIGQLANAGIKGSDAGTALKTMLLSLTAPSEEAAALMRGLGIRVYDAAGAMRPFRDIIGDFHTSLGRLTEAQRNQYLATIFGTDAVRAAAVIFGQGVEGYDKMHDAVTRTGQAQELADAKTKGLSGALDGLTKTIKNGAMEAVLPFKDDIAALARAGSEAIKQFGALDPETKRMVVGFVAAVAVAGPLILLFGGLTAGVAAMLSPVGLAIIAFAALSAWLAAHPAQLKAVTDAVSGLTKFVSENWLAQTALVAVIAAVVTGWGLLTAASIASSVALNAVKIATAAYTAVQWLLNAALTANPIGLVVVALAALAAGLIYAYQHSSTFRNIVDGAFSAVGSAVQAMWNVAQPILSAFDSTIGNILRSLGLLPSSLPAGAPAATPAVSTGGGTDGRWNSKPPGAVSGPNSQGQYQYKMTSPDGASSWYEWRDQGGPGQAGKGYAIGVPELFVPNTGGQFVPLGGAQVTGNRTFNVYIENAYGDDLEDKILRALDRADRRGA